MNVIKLFLILLALSLHSNVYADDVITSYSSPIWVESKQLNQKAALYEVRLTNYFTYITTLVSG